MKLLNNIKNKIINFLDPNMTKNFETLEKDNEILKQEHSRMKLEYDMLDDKYDNILEQYDKSEEKVNKLAEINTILKKGITNKIVQEIESQLNKMSLLNLEFLYKKLNYEDIQLREKYKNYKGYDIKLEIYQSKGEIIDEVSEELLGDEELWDLFPEEDARGTFEFTNGYDNARWREKYHFGKVINIEYISCYEFYTYKLDYANQEYVEYKKKLYREAIPREIERYIDYIMEDNPEILSDTEDYLKRIEKEFQEERKKLEETKEIEYNEKEEETEDEEEM